MAHSEKMDQVGVDMVENGKVPDTFSDTMSLTEEERETERR